MLHTKDIWRKGSSKNPLVIDIHVFQCGLALEFLKIAMHCWHCCNLLVMSLESCVKLETNRKVWPIKNLLAVSTLTIFVPQHFFTGTIPASMMKVGIIFDGERKISMGKRWKQGEESAENSMLVRKRILLAGHPGQACIIWCVNSLMCPLFEKGV